MEIKRDAYLQQLIERKDNGMIKVIGQRKGLLSYLKNIDIERYRSLIERLGLRK